MIDSTVINFALSKFDSLTQKALPHLKEGGMALVDYKVLEIVLQVGGSFIIWTILLSVSLFLLFKFIKMGIKQEWGDESYLWGLVPSIIFSGITIIGVIISLSFLPKIILALKHPVIFTILDLAKKHN